MSLSEGSDLNSFRRKMEKTRSVKEEIDGNVFISHQSWAFPFTDNLIKVLFPVCTLIWPRKGKIGEMKVPLLLYELQPFGSVLNLISNCLQFIETLFPHSKKRLSLLIKVKNFMSVFTADRTFPAESWQL